MNGEILLHVLLVLLFVVIGGVFSATEMAMVTLRASQVSQIETTGAGGQRIGVLVRNPNLFLLAVQVGVTVAGLCSSAYGASTLAPEFVPVLESGGLQAGAASVVAFIGTTLLLAYLSLVLGEGTSTPRHAASGLIHTGSRPGTQRARAHYEPGHLAAVRLYQWSGTAARAAPARGCPGGFGR